MNDDLDPKLLHLYRQIPKEQPSQAVDSAILQAAQQSIANKTYWRPVWGIAASVVMMSSLVWYWQAQQPQELARAVAVSAPPPQAKPVPQKSFEDNAEDENAVMAADEFGSLHDQVVEEKVTVNKPAERQLLLQAKSKQESVQTEELRQLPAAAPVISLEKTKAELEALNVEPRENKASISGIMATDKVEDNVSNNKVADLDRQEKVLPTQLIIEHAYIGMPLAVVFSQDFKCQSNICIKTLLHPDQENYWGIKSLNSNLILFIKNDLVYQLKLETKSKLDNRWHDIWNSLGSNTKLDCQQEKKKVIYQKLWHGYVMILSTENVKTALTICRNE